MKTRSQTRSQTRSLTRSLTRSQTRSLTRSLSKCSMPLPRPSRVVVRAASTTFGMMRQRLAARESREKVKFDYITRPGVLEWLYGDAAFLRRFGDEGEKRWGTHLVRNPTSQWTTALGEGVLNDLLVLRGEHPTRISDDMDAAPRAANNKRLVPDRLTDVAVYECKSRNYTTKGTAGEKILGCPIKYCEVPRLYKKPLVIVCIGFQELEARRDFQLFNPQSPELCRQLAFWKDTFNIRFAQGTRMLEEAL